MLFYEWGWSSIPAPHLLAPLLLASIAAAAIESLPLAEVDNVLAPAAFAFALSFVAS